MQCSPYNESRRKIGSSTSHTTCFFKKHLLSIAKAMKMSGISESNTKMEIWNAINIAMQKQYDCKHGDESCWLNRHSAAAKHKESFVPTHPEEWNRNPNYWLSNIDILNVLTQYEALHTCFKFIGVFPINFAQRDLFGRCISQALCEMSLKKLKKYTSFGVVFNLDRHDQPGSHWVCAFFSLSEPNYGFYYFDSNAVPMPSQIRAFANSIRDQVKNDSFEIHENKIRKQFENNECGMFCINFITKCLERVSFEKIVKSRFYDKDANKLRKLMFRK